jgi:hypothetical protein
MLFLIVPTEYQNSMGKPQIHPISSEAIATLMSPSRLISRSEKAEHFTTRRAAALRLRRWWAECLADSSNVKELPKILYPNFSF